MARRSNENIKFTYTWKIESFNFYRLEEELKSPLFNVSISNITSWYLSFWRKQNSYDFYLNKKNGVVDQGKISYKIDVIDNNDKTLYSTECDRLSLVVDEEENVRYEVMFENIEIVNVNAITIRCSMFLLERITDLVYACQARTKIVNEQCSFKWNVKNFLIGDEVSKVFRCSQSVGIKITLSECEPFISINIESMEDIKNILIVCKISLLDASGFVKESRSSEYFFCENETKSWEFPNFIKKSVLFPENGKYLEHNTFYLMCEFSISKGETLEELEYYHNDDSVVSLSGANIDSLINLQENFRRMYVEDLQTDVEIHAGKQTLQAHKFVLSARSPVFAAMFEQNMLENQTGVVDIPDIEFKILDLLLRFMYDGTVDSMDYDSAYKLLMAADKYQVLVLKRMCSVFLMSNLNNDNVCDVLSLADKVSHEALKDTAVQYIVKHSAIILPSEAWSHFIQNNNKLVTDVMSKLSTRYASYKETDITSLAEALQKCLEIKPICHDDDYLSPSWTDEEDAYCNEDYLSDNY